jgi:hypothetical protein
MTKKRGLATSTAVVVLLFARAVVAQSQNTIAQGGPEWLKDRKYTEGIGIRAGDLELHPGIAGEVGYDSNVFLRSTQTGVDNGAPAAPIIPSAVVRITPSLYLSTVGVERREGDPTPPAVAFRAGVNATYRALFGLSSDASDVAPDGTKPNDPSQLNTVSGAADARLSILPGRPAGIEAFGGVARTVLPNTASADPDVSFTQDLVRVGGELVTQPGGGTLDWRLGYEFDDTLFESTAGVPYDNYLQRVYTRGRWRFRPRTALVYDGSISFNRYANVQAAFNAAGLVSSMPVRARIGVNGLVTDRFSVLLMAGWGASFIDTAPLPQQQQYDSVIGQAELKWYLTANPGVATPNEVSLSLSSIAIGYTRDFQTSYLGNYYGIDRGYLKFDYFFAGRAYISLSGGVGAIEYPNIWDPNGTTERHAAFTDTRADATLLGEYRFTDTFAINSTLRYTQNFSNQTIPEIGSTATYGMAWQHYEAYLGVRWFM